MREIKFRAWDKKLNEIINWDELKELIFARYFNELIDDEDIILMQYTGLKDKNGKEIYESDILRYEAGRCYSIKREFIDYKLAEVVFIAPCFEVSPKWTYGNENSALDDAPYRAEIMGNIYENPELLEEKK